MKIELARGSVCGFGDWDDLYISALEDAQYNLECEMEEIVGWLEENLEGRYRIDDEYSSVGTLDLECILLLHIPNEDDAMAFKLTWGELDIF